MTTGATPRAPIKTKQAIHGVLQMKPVDGVYADPLSMCSHSQFTSGQGLGAIYRPVIKSLIAVVASNLGLLGAKSNLRHGVIFLAWGWAAKHVAKLNKVSHSVLGFTLPMRVGTSPFFHCFHFSV
jgi:hypothetical protein